jgi:hypothetical protein
MQLLLELERRDVHSPKRFDQKRRHGDVARDVELDGIEIFRLYSSTKSTLAVL